MRWTVLVLAATAFGLLGSDSACFKPIGEVGGVDIIEDPDTRCTPLAGGLSPGLAFEPSGDRLWVGEWSPPVLSPFDVEEVPPTVAAAGRQGIPPDSDGDSFNDSPRLQGIEFIEISGISAFYGLLPAANYDEVMLFDAASPALGRFEVQVDEAFDDGMFPRLPDRGTGPVERTGLSTVACLIPGPDRPDSRGDEVGAVGGNCGGFYASFTSGAAVAGKLNDLHLFAAMANPGPDGRPGDPHYLPGAVLVYKVGLGTPFLIEPDRDTHVIYTSGFNPSQVTPYSVNGRNFILVSVTGPISAVADDVGTPEVEGGFTIASDAVSAIDVIDADTLELVATIPLGPAGIAGNLVVHPTAPLAVVGSVIDRWVLAVDLTPLADPDLRSVGPPVILGGSGRDGNFADAVIHDAEHPYWIDDRVDGAAAVTCPGITGGAAFSNDGSLLYISEFCDGTIATIRVSATTPPGLFESHVLTPVTAPIDTSDVAEPRGPGALAVRPKTLGTFTGPDLFVLVAQPGGLLCAISAESGP